MFLIILAAILAPAVLIFHIFKRDKYQPEPTKELLKGFGWGILSVIVSLSVTIPFQYVFPSINSPEYNAFVLAAIPEESAKLFCLWLFLRKNKYFNEYMDGIVYAVTIGMGFAALENVVYLINNYDNWVNVALMRSILSVPGHFAFAIVMGYYYSLWRINNDKSSMKKMWLMPILAHGIYDAILMYMELAPIFTVILLGGLGFFLYKLRQHCTMLIKRHLESDQAS